MGHLTVDIITGKENLDRLGMKRCQQEITSDLSNNIDINYIRYKSIKNRFFDGLNYIRSTKKQLRGDISHIAIHHYSYLANFINFDRLIITCHGYLRLRCPGKKKDGMEA